MIKTIVFFCTLIALVAVLIVLLDRNHPAYAPSTEVPIMSSSTTTSLMRLTSSAFENGGMIPATYTCNGKDLLPPLSISNIPKGTKSLTFILEDPDTSIGTFDHWVLFNVDPIFTQILEGKEPFGTHGKASSGDLAYVSPCPPTGIHRYMWSVYALSEKLNLPEGVSKNEVIHAMNGHILDKAELMGRYGK